MARSGLSRSVLAAAAALLALSACDRAPQPRTAAMPTPISGWDDVKNVSRLDRFTFAGQPTEAALKRFADDGGRLVIDIRTQQGKDAADFPEEARVQALGLTYVHIPVTPATMSRADVDKFAQAIDSTPGPVLFHCASSNRVGSLWAAYLALKRRVPTEEAIASGRAAGLSSSEAEAAARRVIGP